MYIYIHVYIKYLKQQLCYPLANSCTFNAGADAAPKNKEFFPSNCQTRGLPPAVPQETAHERGTEFPSCFQRQFLWHAGPFPACEAHFAISVQHLAALQRAAAAPRGPSQAKPCHCWVEQHRGAPTTARKNDKKKRKKPNR